MLRCFGEPRKLSYRRLEVRGALCGFAQEFLHRWDLLHHHPEGSHLHDNADEADAHNVQLGMFQNAPNKIYNVPVLVSVWLGALNTEWMIERGGLEFFEDLAIRRSSLLYDFIDNSDGFYRTFVTNRDFRSRMQVVFTIRTGDGLDYDLVEKFLTEANDELGWLDIRSHPLGVPSDAIRVTMYNHQTEDTVKVVREFMHDFQKRHATKVWGQMPFGSGEIPQPSMHM